MPPYSSFDEAWAAFLAGGALQTAEQHREEFTRGRAQFLAFQAPVPDDATADLAGRLLDELADVDGLIATPPQWWHITVLPVGFQVIETRLPDDVLRQEVSSVAERAAAAVKRHRPIDVTAGPVNVFPDALILELHDEGALARLREDLRGCLPERLAAYVAAGSPPFLPHVSIASFASEIVAAPLRERLPALRELPAVGAAVRRIELARWWFTGFDERQEMDVEVVRSYVLR